MSDLPESYTVTEWAVQYTDGAPFTLSPPRMFEYAEPWTEETARAEVKKLNESPINQRDGRVAKVYSRTRVITPDKVSDWKES